MIARFFAKSFGRPTVRSPASTYADDLTLGREPLWERAMQGGIPNGIAVGKGPWCRHSRRLPSACILTLALTDRLV